MSSLNLRRCPKSESRRKAYSNILRTDTLKDSTFEFKNLVRHHGPRLISQPALLALRLSSEATEPGRAITGMKVGRARPHFGPPARNPLAQPTPVECVLN